jgi:predicted Rossmann fold nucleotide-binding protein DprA/Smf involved in DNA uptake
MNQLKKNLEALSRDLKVLADKTERWLKMLEKYEKPKAKPAKATAVKKAPIKKVAAKKAAPKKAVPKKAKPATAVDTVLAIIKRSKKGVNMAALMEKTGYNQKKVANLVFKLRKQGKIKSVAKGVYVKA